MDKTDASQKQELFKFAYFPEYDNAIMELAENMAEPEVWDFGHSKIKRYGILKVYLEHTFRKLKKDNAIGYDRNNEWACFNTGLMTPSFESIYALFQKNLHSPDLSFYFKGFQKASSSFLLRNFQCSLPESADYFSDPSKLLYNPRMKIDSQIDHIIHDNIERFPTSLKAYGEQQLRQMVKGAIEETALRLRANYKLAVPQYYNGTIQLLIPLFLTGNGSKVDIALAIIPANVTSYTARTCLTLNMAYSNARLIVKPQSDWLTPN